MKYTGIIITAVVLLTIGLFAFATPDNTPKNNPVPTNDYKEMWKKVKENLDKNLPE